jgi:chromosome segregation ATPase
LENLETDIERRRVLLTTLDESVSSRYAKVTTDIQNAEKRLNDLEAKEASLLTTIAFLKQGIFELSNVEIPDTTSLQRSIIREMNTKIEELDFAAKIKTNEVEKLNNACEKKEEEIETLEDTKASLSKDRAQVQKEILMAREKFNSILHSLERSENQMKDLIIRERDIAIKERRLSPVYQEVFNRVNRRKK